MNIPFDTSEVSSRLLRWYESSGRDLPWRQTRNPYRIWLSEIMLQQTTVAAVVPYYEKFLATFPDVKSLATANLEAVLELWSGLGYYSRARNLHRAAKIVADERGGLFPETVEELQQLPGIGRSTAGAIVSIAHDRPAPILDGNVRRVLVRLMALQKPPREAAAERKLWQWAEALTPTDRPHDYAQAIMDLGATICLPRQPRCPDCPLQEFCRARMAGLESELPVRNRKTKIPLRRQVVLVVRRGDDLLVRRRPPAGLLGGMWEFPCLEISSAADVDAAVQQLLKESAAGCDAERAGSIMHVYSHFRLEADVYLATAPGSDKIAESDSFWHDEQKLADSPLHGAHQKALTLLMKEEN